MGIVKRFNFLYAQKKVHAYESFTVKMKPFCCQNWNHWSK